MRPPRTPAVSTRQVRSLDIVAQALGTAIRCAVLVTAIASCAAPERRGRIFEDLGEYHRPVTTNSAEAQRYFDQGLLLVFSFNLEEAVRSFREAARIDPRCAMAHWGAALAAGPHINNQAMTDDAVKAACEDAAKARALAAGATPVERDLIDAVSKRYVWPPPADRRSLDAAYAEAMRDAHLAHPADPDVAILFADALMNLQPWDLWTPDGQPKGATDEIVAAIEGVLASHPDHPGALHLHIHAVEASPNPAKGVPSADRLRDRVPGSGHLVHMPSHIYMRVGRYRDAIAANQRAVAADRKYVARAGKGGFHDVYRAHNFHFLAFAAMFDGQSEIALAAARDLVAEIPEETARGMPEVIDGFLGTPYCVLVRFGRWEEILREPKPPAYLPVTTAFWIYSRGVAYSVTGRLDEAEGEISSFTAAAAAVPESFMIGNNTARSVLEVADAMLAGEYLFRRGRLEDAFARLRDGMQKDVALKYDEPWGWMQPVAHALGALLVQAGRLDEAKEVYRQDLLRYPENAWSLHGLAECLQRLGEAEEARKARSRFEAAWARADVRIPGSCFCRTET